MRNKPHRKLTKAERKLNSEKNIRKRENAKKEKRKLIEEREMQEIENKRLNKEKNHPFSDFERLLNKLQES